MRLLEFFGLLFVKFIYASRLLQILTLTRTVQVTNYSKENVHYGCLDYLVIPLTLQRFQFLKVYGFVTLVNSFGMPLGFIAVFLLLQVAIRGSELSRRLIQTDKQDAVVAYGATVLLFMQAMLVILGSCNIIPLAGLPIPFLSRGGTYQAIVFFFAGLLLQMSQREEEFEDGDLAQGGDDNDDEQAFSRIDLDD